MALAPYGAGTMQSPLSGAYNQTQVASPQILPFAGMSSPTSNNPLAPQSGYVPPPSQLMNQSGGSPTNSGYVSPITSPTNPMAQTQAPSSSGPIMSGQGTGQYVNGRWVTNSPTSIPTANLGTPTSGGNGVTTANGYPATNYTQTINGFDPMHPYAAGYNPTAPTDNASVYASGGGSGSYIAGLNENMWQQLAKSQGINLSQADYNKAWDANDPLGVGDALTKINPAYAGLMNGTWAGNVGASTAAQPGSGYANSTPAMWAAAARNAQSGFGQGQPGQQGQGQFGQGGQHPQGPVQQAGPNMPPAQQMQTQMPYGQGQLYNNPWQNIGGYNSWGNPYEGNPFSFMTGQVSNGLNPMMSALFGGGQNGNILQQLMGGMGGQGGLGGGNPLSGGLQGISSLAGLLNNLGGMNFPQFQQGPNPGMQSQGMYYPTFY